MVLSQNNKTELNVNRIEDNVNFIIENGWILYIYKKPLANVVIHALVLVMLFIKG